MSLVDHLLKDGNRLEEDVSIYYIPRLAKRGCLGLELGL